MGPRALDAGQPEAQRHPAERRRPHNRGHRELKLQEQSRVAAAPDNEDNNLGGERPEGRVRDG